LIKKGIDETAIKEMTCPLKRDPIVKLGSQEVKNEQDEIFGRTHHQQASTSRGSAIQRAEHSRDMPTDRGKGTDIL
jgi:hypothetical protein